MKSGNGPAAVREDETGINQCLQAGAARQRHKPNVKEPEVERSPSQKNCEATGLRSCAAPTWSRMRETSTKFAELALFVLAAFYCVHAQDEPVQDLGSMDVVSAAPVTQSKSSSVVELTRDAWEGKPYSAAELLATLPGVQHYRQGGLGSFQTVSIRGIAAKNIVICMDGIPMNDGSGGAVDLGQIDLNQIEKIEIYKDRVPAKFGGSGIGGAVNFVTKSAVNSANAKKTKGRILASYGSHNFWEGSAQVQTSVTDSVTFAAALSARHSDNDYEFKNRNGTEYNTEDDFTDVRRNAQYTEYSGNLKYRVLHGFGGFSIFALNGSMSEAGNPGREDAQTSVAGFRGQNASAIYRMEFPELFGWLWLDAGLSGRFEKNLSRSHYKIDHVGYASNKLLEYGAFGYRVAPDVVASYYGESLELNLRLAGGFDRYEPRGYSEGWSLERKSISISGDGAFQILPWISLGAEGSVQSVSDDVSGGVYVTPTFSGNIVDSEKNHISYSARGYTKIGLPDSHFGGHASFGKFYRKPELMELFGVYPGVLGNPKLQDENALRFEAGVFATSPSKKSVLRATYFDTWTDNGIFWIITAVFMKPINMGEARIRGFEMELESNPISFMRTTLHATFQDTKNRSSLPYYHNNMLPGEPKRSYFAELQLLLPFHFDISWMTEYRTKIYSDEANLTKQPASTTHKATLGYNPFKQTRLIFAVDNITDETYRNIYTPFPTPGREYRLTLTQGF